MNKKIGCKKCGTKQYSVVVVSKKTKKKYFSVCDNCKNKRRLYPKGVAYGFYYNLCEYETALATKDLQDDKYFTIKWFSILDKFKKEYKYIYYNLISFTEFIYNNNYHRKFDSIFAVTDFMNILKNYKEPLTDETCVSIYNELGKMHP